MTLPIKPVWADKVIDPLGGCVGHLGDPGCDVCPALVTEPDVTDAYAMINKVSSWKTPRTIALGWWSDLFDPHLYPYVGKSALDLAVVYPQHTFIVLTKWDVAMSTMLHSNPRQFCRDNLWYGVSVSSSIRQNERIHTLQYLPTPNIFVVWEPILGPLSHSKLWPKPPHPQSIKGVIAGGMLGKDAQGYDLDALRRLRDACADRDVPFCLTQIGHGITKSTDHNGHGATRVRILDGQTHDSTPWEKGPRS